MGNKIRSDSKRLRSNFGRPCLSWFVRDITGVNKEYQALTSKPGEARILSCPYQDALLPSQMLMPSLANPQGVEKKTVCECLSWDASKSISMESMNLFMHLKIVILT